MQHDEKIELLAKMIDTHLCFNGKNTPLQLISDLCEGVLCYFTNPEIELGEPDRNFINVQTRFFYLLKELIEVK